jgi:cell fate (sporulation/competence/biofilm development) regulator YlbF (YheA/YmcA/DUF963 family)
MMYSKEEQNEINDYNRKINDLNHIIANLMEQRHALQLTLDSLFEKIQKRNEKKNA